MLQKLLQYQQREAADDAATIEVFACTAGTWYMDGDPDTASLVMDGEGGVAAYYATGNLEYSGYLECTDANIRNIRHLSGQRRICYRFYL